VRQRAGTILVFLALFFALSSAVWAQQKPVRTVVVLISGVALPQVATEADFAVLRDLAQNGAVAALNTAVAGEPTDAAAFLSVGASERMTASRKTEPNVSEGGVLQTVADLATEVYALRGVEGSEVANVYRRRMGQVPSASATLVHLGIPALLRAQVSPARGAQIGALGEVLRRAGRRVAVYGGYHAVLVGMDAQGMVPFGSLSPLPAPHIETVLRQTDVLVLYIGNVRTLNTVLRPLSRLSKTQQANVLVACPAPPRTSNSSKWHTLGFVVAAGPSFAPNSLLLSPTTRTPGLVANVDLAPTIANLQGAGPLPGAAGQTVTTVLSGNAFTVAQRISQQTTVATDALIPVMVSYGVWAIGFALLASFAVTRSLPRVAAFSRWGLQVAAAALLALLILSLYDASNVAVFTIAFAATSVALTLLATWLGRNLRVSPLGIILALTAVTVIGDAVFGSPLVSRSVLSGYYLAGVRFYGIGNEYMGILVGSALVTPPLLTKPGKTPRILWTVPLYALSLLALANPAWGADAGGALGATVAFSLVLMSSRFTRPRLVHVVIAFACGFVVLGLVAVWDRLLPGAARSHIGNAVGTGQTRGLAALGE